LRVSGKKIIPIAVLVLILFAAILALTDEIDMVLPALTVEEEPSESIENEIETGIKSDKDIPPWVKPVRWFKSNPGGMALEEMQSRFAALRHKYALALDIAHRDELPDYLIPYYKDEYLLEVRILYKDGEQQRSQWIFRDENGKTRLNAVFMEPSSEIVVMEDLSAVQESAAIASEETEMEEDQIVLEDTQTQDEIQDEEEKIAHTDKIDVKYKKGFLEIFNEDSFLIVEYRYFENGKIAMTEYALKDNLLIKAEYMECDIGENDGEYKTLYIDYYRYNRSLSLRNIERVFYKDSRFEDPVRVAFPMRIMDAVHGGIFISERLNIYPDFFGDVYVDSGSKMIFDTDNRGRIMSQTLYDSEDKVIWTIHNIWQNDRIVSSSKTEGDSVLLAEFAYNSNGDRILERNSKNGKLERVVRAEEGAEIEELYINNTLVLRAVWEDGRKISETRVRN